MKTLKIEKLIKCPKCKGKGKLRKLEIGEYSEEYVYITCNICKGMKKVRIDLKQEI